jgi:hypothetical protein
MQIPEKKVQEYMDLYLKKYGTPIDRAHALKELLSLVCLLDAVHKHINRIK